MAVVIIVLIAMKIGNENVTKGSMAWVSNDCVVSSTALNLSTAYTYAYMLVSQTV